MTAKDVLRLFGLVVLAMTHKSVGQDACIRDGHCTDDLCCKDDGTCSTRDANSVLGGEMADDHCECLSDVFDAANGVCKDCSKEKHCEGDFCCMDNNMCSTRNFDSVLGGGEASDHCECVSDVYDAANGVCKECSKAKHCEGDLCCMDNNDCSTRNANSVLGGGEASDHCECLSDIYDAAKGVCSREENSVRGGEKAEDHCECRSDVYLADSETCLGCTKDNHCDDPFCCKDNGECSTRAEDTVLGGEEADDHCECLSDIYDPVTSKCMCTADEHCEEPFCCMLDGMCSSRGQGSVAQGQAADDQCECFSNIFTSDGICGCADDSECEDGEACCPEDLMCRKSSLTDPTACGDPHMTGFNGQKFDFTGDDGRWYVLVSDPLSMHLNMRVTAPVPSLPEITYITGLSLISTDTAGAEHNIVISVKDPHNLDSACPKDVYPCLADGSLNVVIDGEESLVAPGTVTVGPGMQITAVNIPGECRSFGFETYWERKKLEYAQSGRRLGDTLSIGEWVLADPTATNMAECVTYVSRAMLQEGGMFAHQSEHASFQIVTPTGTIRLSHGRLHQLPMRDPTDQFDLPDHLTWQMNMAIDRTDISPDARGILGETFVPTLDEYGKDIMHGMECIRGEEADYAVLGPLGVAFAQADCSF